MTSQPIIASSSIAAWLEHPEGGRLIRGLLAQTGIVETRLAPVRRTFAAAAIRVEFN